MSASKRKGEANRLVIRIGKAARPLDELTRKIVEAHEENPTVHRQGEHPMPSMEVMNRVVDHFFEVIAPGYGRAKGLGLENAPYHIGRNLDLGRRLLNTQVYRELVFRSEPDACDKKQLRAKARLIVEQFSATIPSLIQKLAEDIAAAFFNDPAAKSTEMILLCYPGVRAIRAYRIAHELHRLGLQFVPRMISELAHSKTGIDIHPGATIGRRSFIDHGTGLTIGETTVIGDDVTLFQGVTLGARKFDRDAHGSVRHEPVKRHPTIGNQVTIYANATVLGADTVVGDEAVIGGSTWITKSVSTGQIVTAAEQQLVSTRNRLASKPAETFTQYQLSEADLAWVINKKYNRCDDY